MAQKELLSRSPVSNLTSSVRFRRASTLVEAYKAMGGNGIAAYMGEIMYATDVGKAFIYTGSKWEELGTACEKHESARPQAMICTQCGAPINEGNYCEYCDTRYR